MSDKTKHSCFNCAHLRREYESWELPNIAWYVCDERRGVDNLLSFPFRATSCKKFTQAARQGVSDEHGTR